MLIGKVVDIVRDDRLLCIECNVAFSYKAS